MFSYIPPFFTGDNPPQSQACAQSNCPSIFLTSPENRQPSKASQVDLLLEKVHKIFKRANYTQSDICY